MFFYEVNNTLLAEFRGFFYDFLNAYKDTFQMVSSMVIYLGDEKVAKYRTIIAPGPEAEKN